MTLPLPREHGAWGILLIPFLTAVVVAGKFSPAVLLALAAVLAAFLARYPLELLLLPARAPSTPPARAQLRPWAWAYTSVAAALGLLLVAGWRLYLLLPLGALALAFFALHLWAGRKRRAHAAPAELLGALGLTLSAPVAWVAATGGLDATGALVWLLNAVFFCSGVLYVRARIRRRQLQRRPEAAAFGRLTLGFHGGVVFFVLALVYWREASLLVAVPFLVAAARAAWGAHRPPFNLRRLGWTEVALSLFFAGCLTLGFRL